MTALRYILPLRTRNPLNMGMGNTRLAAIIRTQERAKHRAISHMALVPRLNWPGFPAPPYVVTLTRISAGKMDDDGLAASQKGIRDGIAEALGIDDGDRGRLRFRYRQRKGPAKHHAVEVLVQTASEAKATDVVFAAERGQLSLKGSGR